jgi:hypothetical protein
MVLIETDNRWGQQMMKILNTFRDQPTAANASKLTAYLTKHPMSACLLTAHDYSLLSHRIAFVSEIRDGGNQ